MFALNLEYGISTVSCLAAFRITQTRKHVCDRICHCHLGLLPFLAMVFRRPHASSRSVRAADLQRRCLPTGLRNAGQFTAVSLHEGRCGTGRTCGRRSGDDRRPGSACKRGP